MVKADRRIVHTNDVETLAFDWGELSFTSQPAVTNAQNFSFGIVTLKPGMGHDRHNHPGVEEIIHCISGSGSQMVDDQPNVPLVPGTTVHIPADMFHATLNNGTEPLILAVVYSPHGPEAFLKSLPECTVIPPPAK